MFNRLSARIAVSEAAAWTGRRWFGGGTTIVPNGVDLEAAPAGPVSPSEELRILFVGRPEERKGLPILLTAFGALVEHVPCRLTVIGAEHEDVLRYLADPELMASIDIHGRVSGEELWSELHRADVLCAPSLSGESFGMVLTEAFAAGTPVVASAIAGYSDVVTDGVDGVLVPPADPQRLAEELQRLYHEPERLAAMGAAARDSAQRYAWPRVADQVTAVYGGRSRHRSRRPAASASPIGPACVRPTAAPAGRPRSCLTRPGAGPARQARPPRRPPHRARRRRLLGIGLTLLAARARSASTSVESIVRSDLTWVLIAAADGAARSSSAPPPGTGSPARRCRTGRSAAATSPRRR